jgi:hypothetical protein
VHGGLERRARRSIVGSWLAAGPSRPCPTRHCSQVKGCLHFIDMILGDFSLLFCFFQTEKDLYYTWEHSTNPFYMKDPQDYTKSTEHTTKASKLHRRSPPPITPSNQAGEASNDDVGKKTTCQDRRTAPRFGIAAAVDAMSNP